MLPSKRNKSYRIRFSVFWYNNKKQFLIILITIVCFAIIIWFASNYYDIHIFLKKTRGIEGIEAFGYVVLVIGICIMGLITACCLIGGVGKNRFNKIVYFDYNITPVRSRSVYVPSNDCLIVAPPSPLYKTNKYVHFGVAKFMVVAENRYGIEHLVNLAIAQRDNECYRISTAFFLSFCALHQHLKEISDLTPDQIKELIQMMDASFANNKDSNGNICGSVKNGGSRTKLLLSISHQFGFYSKEVQRFKYAKFDDVKSFISVYGGFICGLQFPPTISDQMVSDGEPFILKDGREYDWIKTTKEQSRLLEHALFIGAIVKDEKEEIEYFVAVNSSDVIPYLLIPTTGEWGVKVLCFATTYPISAKCLEKMDWDSYKYKPTTTHLATVTTRTAFQNKNGNKLDHWGGDLDLRDLFVRH